MLLLFTFFFFFNDTATTEIYTLSLHDALPISESGLASSRARRLPCVAPLSAHRGRGRGSRPARPGRGPWRQTRARRDRKSTRLNSSHLVISYAVFCLKKKKYEYARDTHALQQS